MLQRRISNVPRPRRGAAAIGVGVGLGLALSLVGACGQKGPLILPAAASAASAASGPAR